MKLCQENSLESIIPFSHISHCCCMIHQFLTCIKILLYMFSFDLKKKFSRINALKQNLKY